VRAADADPIAVAGPSEAATADLELEVAGAEGSRDLRLN
jgi:hypothetical protein